MIAVVEGAAGAACIMRDAMSPKDAQEELTRGGFPWRDVTSLVTAVAALLGVLVAFGVSKIAADSARDNQAAGLAEQRAQSEREELRHVLDSAATALTTGHAETYTFARRWYLGKTSIPASRAKSVYDALDAVDDQASRLLLRLGRASPIYKYYVRTLTLLDQVKFKLRFRPTHASREGVHHAMDRTTKDLMIAFQDAAQRRYGVR